MRQIAFLSLVLLPLPALAHEPLWGETPQTFAFGVVHPEFRFAHGETRFSLQYAPETTRNLRLEVPFVANGQVGDSVLSIKSRLHARFGPDFKQMDALILGVQTGHLGGQVGYAFAHERLTDTIWASAMHTRTKTGGMTEFDAAYGYWVKRASTPVDTGVVLALGGHRFVMPGERLTGVHSSLIVTKGQTQARFGMLFPTHTRPGAGALWNRGITMNRDITMKSTLLFAVLLLLGSSAKADVKNVWFGVNGATCPT